MVKERNPFEYGSELGLRELVERDDELDEIAATIRNRTKLFLIGPRRFGNTSLLSAADEAATKSGAVIIRLDRYNEPHPDVAVVRLREDRYGTSHPGGGDTLLVIEVCETSHWYDRNVKLPIYARSGVPEVWVVELPGRRIEQYRAVSTDAYATIDYVEAGGVAKSSVLEWFTLDTEGL